MSTLEQNFRTALLADATVNDYLSGRLHPIQLPPSPTFPCAAFQRISTPGQIYSHSPAPGQQGKTNWARMQVTVWAGGANGAQVSAVIGGAIVNALQTFNLWDLPGSPDLTPRSFPNFVLNQRMSVEPQTNPPLFKFILDFKIWFRDN